ncbi:MAG: anion permease [Lachnospiraceae bacterium]|nr:anion permease [Lachnospiraceae bacterium]
MISGIIFLICIILFLIDKFEPSLVALAGCVSMVALNCCSVEEAFGGFTNDIIYIVLGTEILGVACQKCGLANWVSEKISKCSMHKIVLILGVGAAMLSAFINNQVVASMVLIICIAVANNNKKVNVKVITLPVIYAVILGGQCTLIGAPATIVSATISKELSGYSLSMFSMAPMGIVILLIGIFYLCMFGMNKGEKLFENKNTLEKEEIELVKGDPKKMIVTLIAVLVMVLLFFTGAVSVGMASMIAAIICLFFRVVDTKLAYQKIDWNIIIWLGCSVGMANALNKSGIINSAVNKLYESTQIKINPILLLIIFVLFTTILSNFVANTTTVLMVLPVAISIVNQYEYNVEPYVIAITMAAGLSVLTPLSCGFIGMTMRLGYKFKDYVKYGLKFQMLLTSLVVILSCAMYKF